MAAATLRCPTGTGAGTAERTEGSLVGGARVVRRTPTPRPVASSLPHEAIVGLELAHRPVRDAAAGRLRVELLVGLGLLLARTPRPECLLQEHSQTHLVEIAELLDGRLGLLEHLTGELVLGWCRLVVRVVARPESVGDRSVNGAAFGRGLVAHPVPDHPLVQGPEDVLAEDTCDAELDRKSVV